MGTSSQPRALAGSPATVEQPHGTLGCGTAAWSGRPLVLMAQGSGLFHVFEGEGGWEVSFGYSEARGCFVLFLAFLP